MTSAAVAVAGHNNPPPDVELDVQALEAAVSSLPAGDLSESNIVQARALLEREVGLRQRLDNERKVKVEPHLTAQREVNGYYNALIERGKTAIGGLKLRVMAYLKAEEDRRQEALRRATADAIAAEEAAVEEEDPFAAFDKTKEAERAARIERDAATVAAAPARIKGGGARSLSLRTSYVVVVTDAEALVKHFADHAKVIELATALAQAQVRGAKGHHCNIAGIRVNEERGL